MREFIELRFRPPPAAGGQRPRQVPADGQRRRREPPPPGGSAIREPPPLLLRRPRPLPSPSPSPSPLSSGCTARPTRSRALLAPPDHHAAAALAAVDVADAEQRLAPPLAHAAADARGWPSPRRGPPPSASAPPPTRHIRDEPFGQTSLSLLLACMSFSIAATGSAGPMCVPHTRREPLPPWPLCRTRKFFSVQLTVSTL